MRIRIGDVDKERSGKGVDLWDAAIGARSQRDPESRLDQFFADRGGVELKELRFGVAFKFDGLRARVALVRLDDNREKSAFCAAIDRLDDSGAGRRKLDARILFVKEQQLTCEDAVAFFYADRRFHSDGRRQYAQRAWRPSFPAARSDQELRRAEGQALVTLIVSSTIARGSTKARMLLLDSQAYENERFACKTALKVHVAQRLASRPKIRALTSE